MRTKQSRHSVSVFLLLFIAAFAFKTSAQTLQSDAVTIKPGEMREWKFTAPQLGADQVAAISLEARLDSPPLGSMYFMDIQLNGKSVRAAFNRLQSRLRNKPLVVAPDKPLLMWNLPDDDWRVLYAPDFTAQYHDIYGPEAFRFVIQIGDLLQPGENTLTIGRTPKMHTKPLVVRNVQITSVPRVAGSTPSVPRAGGTPVIENPDGDSLIIKAGSLRLPVSTSFSVPGGGWVRLGSAITPRENETAVSLSGVGSILGVGWRGSYRNSSYEVARSGGVIGGVTGARLGDDDDDDYGAPEDARAFISDTITNLTDQDLGMMVRHEMKLPAKVPTVFLGGDDNPASNTDIYPQNPTIFVPFEDFSVGLVLEDDVMRSQGIRSYHPEWPGISARTERLVIPARGKVTLAWSVYISPSTDYFDFINRVRRDWGVNNVTINGSWWWGFHPEQILAMSDDTLREWTTRNNTFAVVSSGGWVDKTKKEWLERANDGAPPVQIGFGVGVMEPAFSDLRERFKSAAEKVQRVAPGVRFAPYNHMFFNEPEAEEQRFRNAWITRENGARLTVDWSGTYTRSGGIYPTLSNSFGPAFRAALETQKREMGATGFYIDEANWPSGLENDPITYNAWDGHSAILDPQTFAIKQKVGYVTLLSAAYQNQLFGEMGAQGTWFLGNDAPASMAQNRATWPRFVETQNNIRRSVLAHLYTPLAYGSSSPTVERLRRNLEYGILHSCSGPADKQGIVGKFFPITPTELHTGWVQGKERVVTSVSGKFGWPDEKFGYRIWSYRADGTPVEAQPQWQNAMGLLQVDVPENGIAILERRAS